MRRLLCLLLALLLLGLLVTPASAEYTDIAGHWARKYILRVTELGLFGGTSADRFSPNATMTRGMFVTVLGRLAGIEPEAWKLPQLPYLVTDVPSGKYYTPYVCWALHKNLVPELEGGLFRPEEPITREAMAAMSWRLIQSEGFTLRGEGIQPPDYADAEQIADWARDSVVNLSAAQIFNGSRGSDGKLLFRPKGEATRAECAAIFCRILDNTLPPETPPLGPQEINLFPSALTLEQGKTFGLVPVVTPLTIANRTLLWYSEDPAIATVDQHGQVRGLRAGTVRICCACSSGLVASTQLTVRRPASLASGSMTRAEKLRFIYGSSSISDPRKAYSSEEEAKSHQVLITVKVWDISSNGVKYTVSRSFRVHENLADTVEAIFAEIYELPEKPPINSLSGWRWRSYETSEHNMGLALDLNPAANPYVSKGASAYDAGFRPGEDPYSIPVGGSIDQIFAAYGFRRGIYWNNGNKDYMHYSFFGT